MHRSLPKDELATLVYEDLQKRLIVAPKEIPLEKLLSKDYYCKIKDLVGKSLKEAIIRGCESHKTPSELLDYIYNTEMVRRYNINGRLSYRLRIETVDPFFDYDLIDFACNIPSELRLRRSLVKEELKRYHPELKHIPIEGSLMTDILRTLGQQIHITRIFPWLRHERNVMSAYLRAEKEFIEKILFDDRTLNRGIFDPEAIKRVVRDHMSNKKDYGGTIAIIVSIELWFRLFVET